MFLISNRDALGNLSSAAVVTARSVIYILLIDWLHSILHCDNQKVSSVENPGRDVCRVVQQAL